MRKLIRHLVLGSFFLLWVQPLFAAKELSSAKLVFIQDQVSLQTAEGANQLLKESDILQENVSVSTGPSGFAEFQFTDATVVRLGANSKFSYSSKDRRLQILEGSLIVNVPEGNGGIKIEGGEFLGEATGTTLLASRDRGGNFALIVLETKGSAKLSGKIGTPIPLVSGQIILARSGGEAPKVLEVNLDAVLQYSPLFTRFAKAMPGLDAINAVAAGQVAEIMAETKFLLAYLDTGLKPEDPDKNVLSLILGKDLSEVVSSRNPFLGDLSTAAGTEEGKDAGSQGTVLGGNSLPGSMPNDARQPEGEQIASKSNPPRGDGAGGLGETDTAAGAEDVSGTETAAGGGGAPDTQAPAPVGGGTSVNAPQMTRIGDNLISS